jgi:dolichol-phosphate mannosyltransferase
MMEKEKRKRIVVICPVYNEEINIPYFFDRILKVFQGVDSSRYDCRLLFTNNRSADRTLELIRTIEKENSWVSHITLSRNFGYQVSLLAGLTSAGDSDLYMICDVDCEDPPEMLPRFLEAIEQGNDLAYGIRSNRPDTWLMLRFRSGFYRILRLLGDYTIVSWMAEFAMLKKPIRDAVLSNTNSNPFIRAEVGYVGFKIVGLPYRRESRHFGRTHYNYYQSFEYAISALLSSTTFPLRLALKLLPFLTLANLVLCLLYGLGILEFEPAIFVLLAMNALYVTGTVAFQSVYLARIYHNGLNRERFFIDESQTSLTGLQ